MNKTLIEQVEPDFVQLIHTNFPMPDYSVVTGRNDESGFLSACINVYRHDFNDNDFAKLAKVAEAFNDEIKQLPFRHDAEDRTQAAGTYKHIACHVELLLNAPFRQNAVE